MSPLIIGRSGYLLFGSISLMVLAVAVPADQGKTAKTKTIDGQTVFREKCARCHGAKGEGGPAYSRALTGTRSVTELAKFISQSMPPGPKKCPVPEANAVAAYMYGAFYSPLAQERNRPARVTLSRLTVRQFKNAVADLVGAYHPALPYNRAHGLHAEYFKARDISANARVIERVDPQVDFDFGTDGPEAGKFDPHNFSAAWQGSLLAPDTGEYELIVQSSHAVRLWLNGWKNLVVDGWVRSNNDTEFRGTVSLIGGRAYPIRLEFSKGSQGVNDDDKKKGKPAPKANVTLLWRRPKLPAEPIPTRCLFPESTPTTFVVTTPFPPDDRSIGYERGNTVSKAWDDATTSAALEAAAYVGENLRDITGVPDDAPDRKERLKAFCRGFVERAIRRPLTKEVERTYVDKQFEVAPSPEMAVKRVVLLTLKSPRFLYREVGGPNDAYRTASQLSFGLWDSLPDPELERAAKSGELATAPGVAKQAERMANDPRAWNKLREFLLAWLKVDEVPDIVKNQKRYPGFDTNAAADLRTSMELFLENTAGAEKSDYRELMLSPTEYLNGRLAKLYGANLPSDAPFQPVELDPGQRVGLLTQPYLLSRLAYLDNSSPIHRGVLIVRSLLGRTLNPPPSAFAPIAASLHPDLTTRQRVALQTRPAMCNSCHGMINPLGFTLERFDAIGRLRQTENGKPVDASGSYLSRSGTVVKFSGATDLGKYLADSDEAQSAFVEKLFQHLVKQPALAYGPRTVPDLRAAFVKNRYSIRSLMVQIMMATAAKQESKS